MATRGEPVVNAVGLARFHQPATWCLRKADVLVHAGESVAIIGPSGSGKSTLLTLLGLLDTPTSGRLEICGIDATAATDRERTSIRRERLGFIFQAFHLVPHLTVAENVLFGLEAKGIRGNPARLRTAVYLERVGLASKADEFPGTLSGGEQQRTAIARALATEPSLILCDEPTGNLDSVNSALVLQQLRDAASSSSAVIIVTHDSSVAESCGRTIRVLDGVATEGGSA
jgi:putative ABC transport system ATP-binding protein